jgi:putative transposase
MENKFRNKYRITSPRLKNWDYSNDAVYFVTICTKERKNFFGDIKEHKMKLSEIGNLANRYWVEIPKHFSGVGMLAYVMMPNHIHGLIEINRASRFMGDLLKVNCNADDEVSRFQNQGKGTLSAIIGSFKSVVSREAKSFNNQFSWQSGFYEHIVRNNGSLNRIQSYIVNNISNWKSDELFEDV